ncbi:MAG: hypothetical protein IJE93_07730 [Clostridia bacterium]|nr:hypothetical protein [Clostridia bacterium]
MKRKKKNSIQKSRNKLITKFFTLCFVLLCATALLCGAVTASENTSLRYLGKSTDTVYMEDIEIFVEETKNILFLLF